MDWDWTGFNELHNSDQKQVMCEFPDTAFFPICHCTEDQKTVINKFWECQIILYLVYITSLYYNILPKMTQMLVLRKTGLIGLFKNFKTMSFFITKFTWFTFNKSTEPPKIIFNYFFHVTMQSSAFCSLLSTRTGCQETKQRKITHFHGKEADKFFPCPKDHLNSLLIKSVTCKKETTRNNIGGRGGGSQSRHQ